MRKQLISITVFLSFISTIYATTPGSRVISTNSYDNCIELSNAACRVVLEPNLGGRVLVYEIDGKNVLYIDPKQNGLKFTTEEIETVPGIQPCAGRFDIGPEKVKPSSKLFWQGQWTAEITGKFSARMTSQLDKKTGIQLIRDFKLDAKSSKLKITQTILNLGSQSHKLCFWSRTFATGGGICIVPLSKPNRFPAGYISYGDGNIMQFKPEAEENIRVKDDYFLLLGPTKASKYVYDTDKGWLGYISKNNLLFVKRYEYKKTSEYGEMSASPLSIWYKDEIMAELEPIGPWELIMPKSKATYSETWDLLPYTYPQDKVVDIENINAKVNKLK